jgi:hypothetical protein
MRDYGRPKCCSEVFVLLIFTLIIETACLTPNSNVVQLNSQIAISTTPYNKDFDVDLSGSSFLPVTAKITIVNQSSKAVVMPEVFFKNSSGLNRSSILYSLHSNSPTDTQFAKSTWQFVSSHNYHFCDAGAPGDGNADETSDPMRLLHGFGFSCCQQSARALAWLWQGAGYQTHIVQMPFHTVPEINYGGNWHMYDPDHRVYYLAEDNITVADVAQIIADPELVARTANTNGDDPSGFSAQMMAELYATASPVNYQSVDLSQIQAYLLEPGQSLSLHYANLPSPLFHGSAPLPAGSFPVATGEFDWGLDFSKVDWKQLPLRVTNIATTAQNGVVWATNAGADTGELIYGFASPFPTYSLQVSGLVLRGNSSGAVSVSFSSDGTNWLKAIPLGSGVGHAVDATVNLSDAVAGQYAYYVKFQLSGARVGSAQIAKLHIVSDFQDSIYVFPWLTAGVLNHLTYQDWTPGTFARKVNATFSLN